MSVQVQTVEELEVERKDLHLTTFNYGIVGLSEHLRSKFGFYDSAAPRPMLERLARDPTAAGYTPQKLVNKVVQDVREIMERHRAIDAGKYLQPVIYRRLVTEMLEAQRYAVDAINLYFMDPTKQVGTRDRGSPPAIASPRIRLYLDAQCHAVLSGLESY